MDVNNNLSIGSSSNAARRRLETLPTEIKIMILCQLDDPTLPALIRASPLYRQVFKTYRSEIHTAITLNTLRARKIDLVLQTPLCWLEVSIKYPEPREYRYESRGWRRAIFEYRRQSAREDSRRKFLEHCAACHERAIESISCDHVLAYYRFQKACSQQHQELEKKCEACQDDVIDRLTYQFLPSWPIKLTPKHCTALCNIQDAVGWYWPDGDNEIYCFQRPTIAPYRFPLHTYNLLVMDQYCREDEFWEMLAFKMYTEGPWFREPSVRHKIKDSWQAQHWIELERKRPMNRSAFAFRGVSTKMDWVDEEGMADAWGWLHE